MIDFLKECAHGQESDILSILTTAYRILRKHPSDTRKRSLAEALDLIGLSGLAAPHLMFHVVGAKIAEPNHTWSSLP